MQTLKAFKVLKDIKEFKDIQCKDARYLSKV